MEAPRETIRADTCLQRVRPQGKAAAEQITLAAARDPVGTTRKSDRECSGSLLNGFRISLGVRAR
jgi:hypothetical protein